MATTRLMGEAAMGISHSPCWSLPERIRRKRERHVTVLLVTVLCCKLQDVAQQMTRAT